MCDGKEKENSIEQDSALESSKELYVSGVKVQE